MRTRASVITAMTCASLCLIEPVRAQVQPGAVPAIPLGALEAKVPDAPAILAARSAIDATLDDIAEARAKSGFEYTYQNGIGPAAIIVPREADEHVLHYEQSVGMSIPILGSRVVQQLAIVDAQERAAVAGIAYDEQIRQRIAGLRSAYAQYWQFDRQAQVAQTYSLTEQDALAQARSLRKAGFWTNYNLFDFYVMLQKVKSEEAEFESSRRAQLAKISSDVGYQVAPFAPVQPSFFGNCVPSRDRAIASAYGVDATLAVLNAQITEVNQELARVRGSSIDAHVTASAGSQTDINYRVSGYDLKAGVDVGLPEHARPQERARRDELQAQLSGLGFQQQQRRVELVAEIDANMADIVSAQALQAQAQAESNARRGDLDKALIRYNTIKQEGTSAFDDVQQSRDNLYAAQRAQAEAEAAVLLAAADLLETAPAACP